MIINRIKHYIQPIILKLKYGKNVICQQDSNIDPSLIIRINGTGKVYIGKNVEIRHGVILNVSDGGKIVLDDNVFINDYCCINARDEIHICDGSQLGQGVKIYDHDHDYKRDDFKYKFLVDKVYIGEKCWLGSNVVVLRGTSIGRRCVIGAGTTIKSSVPDYSMIYSNSKYIVKTIIQQVK